MGSALTFVGLLVLVAVFGTLAYGALSAAPWVPVPRFDVERLLELARLKPGEIIYDLGCGDGRLLIKAAQTYDVKAIGFEVSLLPYFLARWHVARSGVGERVKIHYRNFWSAPLGQADVIVTFLTPRAMQRLSLKIPTELKPGARLVSYAFKLPGCTPTITSRPRSQDMVIYLYTKIVQMI